MGGEVIYGSVCSGIEAASVAWKPLGWRPAFFSEIEKFPRAVLAHHYPDVPLHGDFTTIEPGQYEPIDLLVGGTPCQDFSIAGQRAGLDGERGNLTLEYARLAARLGPQWFLWENVPGVFSNDAGRDFGAVIACFAGYPEGSIFEPPEGGWRNFGIVPPAGPERYGLAWAVLDSQYFGVPQRRRRVFVVGYLGDWRPAAAVLLERHSLQGHPPPRRQAGQDVAPTIAARTRGGGGLGTDFDCDGGLIASTGDTAHCLNAGGMGRQDYETETLVAHALRGEDFDASEDGTGRGTPLVPIAIQERAISENAEAGPDGAGIRTDGLAYTLEARQVPQAIAFDTTQITSPTCRSNPQPGDPMHALAAGAHPPAIAFSVKDYGADAGEISPTLRAGGHRDSHANAGVMPAVALPTEQQWAVRRLTPRECERLQGFPDDWTQVPYRDKPAADGPRYKALGNSMAVPVMAWIGQRIQMVEDILARRAA